MNRLYKNILVDVGILYPIVLLAGIIYSESILGSIAEVANVLVAVVAALLLINFPKLVQSVTKSLSEISPMHLIYIVTSSIVEGILFVYVGWYGFLFLWVVIIAAYVFALFKEN